MRTTAKFCMIFLALLPCLPAGAGEEPVLLWRLKSLGIDAEIAGRVSTLLAKEMDRIEGIELIGKERLEAAIDEKPGLGLCGGQTGCLVELGRAVGARRVVSGVLGRLGDAFSLDLKMVDVDQGAQAARIAQTWGGGDETLIEVMRQVATRALRPGDYLGRIALSVNVEQVKVYIDGDYVGRTRLSEPLALAPGRHALKLVRDGYEDVERFVDVVFDRERLVAIHLKETSIHEMVATVRAHRWFSVGLKGGLVTNMDGFLAPQLDLELGLHLPWWSGRLALALQTGARGREFEGRADAGDTDQRRVDGGLLAWDLQLVLVVRPLPGYTFSPFVSAGGGLALVWQSLEPEGFEAQGFRSLVWVLQGGGGLEYRLGPGAVLLEVRYQHLRLDADSGTGGFHGLLGGLGVGLGYRLML